MSFVSDSNWAIGEYFYFCLLLICISLFFTKKKAFNLITFVSILGIWYFLVWGFGYGISHYPKPKILKDSLTRSKISEAEKSKILKFIKQTNKVNANLKRDFNYNSSLVFNNTKKTSSQNLGQTTRFKPSILGDYLLSLGVLGFYQPFTTETFIYTDDFPLSLSFTKLHEKAHQEGICKEFEANIYAYKNLISDTNILSQYEARYFALKQILHLAKKIDPKFYKQMIFNLSLKVYNDLVWEKDYRNKRIKNIPPILAELNILFLNLNRQDGKQAYNTSVEYILELI